jgi:alpha-amylase
MKLKVGIIGIFWVLTISCNNQDKSDHWPYGVNYEVFVRSFADSDGDSIGDFKGLTARLDYLKDLGVGGVWLMPIMNSPTYHKYDVTDYKSIDPEYGTVEDFKTFVAEAHKRDIRVLVDLILNHTGYDHPWFQSAMQGKDSPYRDYYVWAKEDSVREQIAKKSISLDSDNLTQWHPVKGDTLSEHYYGFFWGGMPDLNFDNPKVKEEFIDIGQFWLKEMNVDGFRLDAAKHIFPSERASDNHAFWEWFREEMIKIKPDVYLVGEVWSRAEEVAPYLKGLPALFNFDMGYAITEAVRQGVDSSGLIGKYKSISDYYNQSNREYIDATFLKNHDQNRILSELNGDLNKMKVAASILMSLPGTPYIYYGEEIGMIGTKPDEYIREPFIWDTESKDLMQTKWEKPKYSTDESVIPLAAQKNDPASLYSFYKRWITYRNSSDILTFGSIKETPIRVNELVSLIREKDGHSLLIIHNLSDVELTVSKTDELKEFSAIDFATNTAAAIDPNELRIPAHSSVVVK